MNVLLSSALAFAEDAPEEPQKLEVSLEAFRYEPSEPPFAEIVAGLAIETSAPWLFLSNTSSVPVSIDWSTTTWTASDSARSVPLRSVAPAAPERLEANSTTRLPLQVPLDLGAYHLEIGLTRGELAGRLFQDWRVGPDLEHIARMERIAEERAKREERERLEEERLDRSNLLTRRRRKNTSGIVFGGIFLSTGAVLGGLTGVWASDPGPILTDSPDTLTASYVVSAVLAVEGASIMLLSASRLSRARQELKTLESSVPAGDE